MKVVKVGAMWCNGCIVMRKVWNKVIKQYPNLEIVELDIDFDEDDVKQWNIGDVLPVAIFLDDQNNEIIRLIGEKTEQEIVDVIKEV